MTQDIGIIEAIIAVFEAVLGWLVDGITAIIPVFYVPATGLTFLGVLAVISLCIGLFFLIMRLVQNFVRLRV